MVSASGAHHKVLKSFLFLSVCHFSPPVPARSEGRGLARHPHGPLGTPPPPLAPPASPLFESP